MKRGSVPSLKQIYRGLETAEISAEGLRPYIGFKEGNYWRHRDCRNKFVEIWCCVGVPANEPRSMITTVATAG